MQSLSLFFLAALAIGGIAWVLIEPLMSGERKRQQRTASAARAEPIARSTRMPQKGRREQVENTLKELEARQKKATRPPLSVRISQAGLDLSERRFIVTAAIFGIIVFAVTLVVEGPLTALGFGFAGAVGLPLWLLRFLKKRREARFLETLPEAVDVIVRGIKAGLPLLDSLKMIARDAPEPVRSEFRAIVETQTIGLPLGDACLKLYERIPVAEANFFGIVVSIQQRSGGNLAEALTNLSRVLRDRKKMKGKIKAMSQEAKASAAIIGSLPIIVLALVYFTSPSYIELLWTKSVGRMMLTGSAVWMTLGILVMRRMINFDF